jgi:hypothetical protein
MKFFLKITGRSKRVPKKQRANLSHGGIPAFSESLCVGLLLARKALRLTGHDQKSGLNAPMIFQKFHEALIFAVLFIKEKYETKFTSIIIGGKERMKPMYSG